jgi:hypothetical protein
MLFFALKSYKNEYPILFLTEEKNTIYIWKVVHPH